MRRPKATTFDDYLCRRCDFIHRELGGDVDLTMQSTVASPDIVVLEARVTWPDELELRVFEVIEKTDEGTAHRYRYCYQARWRGQLILRYERDPIGHPEMPEHKHVTNDSRTPSGSVRLSAAVAEMWQEYDRRKKARPAATADEEARAG